jgi:hypothetical protein
VKRLFLAITTMATVTAGLLGPVGPVSAATTWNDGSNDSDQIIDCITQKPSTGVSANVGWSSPTGQVPRVGETFWLRGYVGLVGLPCSGRVAVLPEILVPAGVEHADEPTRWDLTRAGQQQDLSTDPLGATYGANGGILIGYSDGAPFQLRQGDILEFQFPVKATRELKGPATQQPNCQSRLDGDAPCPLAQSGDHLQVAFTVGGHGSDKHYVTPYVGLFATNANPTPTTPTTPTTTPPTPTGPGTGKATSTTRATWKLSAARKGKVTVTVAAPGRPTGRIVVKDNDRAIAQARLVPSDQGRVVVRLPKLRKGKHVMVVYYGGSARTASSASVSRTIRLR